MLAHKKSLLGLVVLFFTTFTTTIAQTEKEAINQLHDKKYDQAEENFLALLKKQPQNAIAHFGLSKLYFEKQQNIRKSQSLTALRYTNFQPHFDLLKKAYYHAQQTATNYPKLTSTQKELTKLFSVPEAQWTGSLALNIEGEAFNLLNTMPYRNTFEQLYNSQVYNKELDADTLIALRDALHDQCTDFLATYKNSARSKDVQQIRKDLFLEMLNPVTVRRYGDKTGRLYEQHCELILKYYNAEELKLILPQFYGMEYNFGTDLNTDATFLKLKEIATNEKMTVLELLCKLNIHHNGCTPATQGLYDKVIRSLAPADIAYIAVQKVAAPLVKEKKWAEAASVYKNYAPLFGNDKRFTKIIELLNTPEDNISLTNLGKNVNSAMNDYSPVWAADGTLYFARRNENTGEDVYNTIPKNLVTFKNPTTNLVEFQAALPLGKVNTKSHEIPLSVSIDGKTLVLFGNYSGLPEFFYVLKTEKRLGKGDIYYVNKRGNSFDKVEVFPYPVNSENYEADLSISPDNQAVLFCSDRKGAVGGFLPNYPENGLYHHGSGEFNTDIWVATKNGKGGYNEPINLGEVINTPFAERKPFLHPDMKTLYFCSEGHYGLGAYDIFMSKRLNDTSWTAWSEPVNLGKVINSPYDDSFYIGATGDVAFIVSNKLGQNFGKSDIYQITIPTRFRPQPVVAVAGTVTDDTGKPTKAKIVWQENTYDQQSTNSGSNPKKTNLKQGYKGEIDTDENGQFYFVVPENKPIVYFAEKENYFSGSLNIKKSTNATTLQNTNTGTIPTVPNNTMTSSNANISNNLQMSSTDRNNTNRKPFVLKNLNFDHNSDVIRPESYFDLFRLVELLQKNPTFTISIEGHTDNAGSHDFNMDLSQRRATAVKNFLVKNGINPNNLKAKGFGETVPIADNTTEVGKEQNRRVEFKIE
jgi:outer membrane protein OmpA-like peptidoglycan-associated protein